MVGAACLGHVVLAAYPGRQRVTVPASGSTSWQSDAMRGPAQVMSLNSGCGGGWLAWRGCAYVWGRTNWSRYRRDSGR